ncbi:MAG TPA: hypothetical protein VKS01_09645 [Bryobacteraceae bacterium]|nr:hypothetical protein [Bryobacteraceae bacterium]
MIIIDRFTDLPVNCDVTGCERAARYYLHGHQTHVCAAHLISAGERGLVGRNYVVFRVPVSPLTHPFEV